MKKLAVQPSSDTFDLPGKYRILVLIVCWIGFTLTSTDRSAWGPASLFVGKDLGVQLGSLGVFATSYYLGYVASNFGSGFLIDKIGGRSLISASLAGAGTCMYLFGSTGSATVGIAIQGIIGLFAGAEYGAGIKLLSSWFRPGELGKVMGVYTSATSLGVLIANTAVPWLIDHFNWSTAYHTFGIISIMSGIICFIILKPGPVVTIAPGSDAGSASVVRSLVGNWNLVLLALSGFGGFWGTYGFVIWSNILIVKGRGIDHATAGIIVATFAAMGILGKPLVGLVSDWMGGARRIPAIFMLALFAVMLIVFGLIETPTGFILAAPVLGLAGYCYLPMIVALVPRLVPSSVLGTAAGSINAFWQLGSVIVPLAVGAVFVAANQSFISAFVTLAIGPLLGMIAMLFVNERPADVQIVLDHEPNP